MPPDGPDFPSDNDPDDDPDDGSGDVPTGLPGDPYFDHVLLILGFNRALSPPHPVFPALIGNGYSTFPSLFQLRRVDVEALTYLVTPDAGGAPVPTHLPRGTQTMLLVPQGYRTYFTETHHRPMTSQDWMDTTVGNIHDYIMSDS